MNKNFSNPNEHLVDNKAADEAIYQTLDFYENPKEYFSLTLDEIERELGKPASLLDVGCANGAFLHHAQKRFAGTALKGMDPIQSLASLAHENLKNVTIYNRNIFDESVANEIGTSTAVTMLGVMYLFREPEKVVSSLLSLVDNGGAAFIFSSFNEEPVDVLLNYRQAPKGEWVQAHNMFSMETMESTCAEMGASCRWVDFSMSKPIPKTDDPMRSWTEPFRGNPHHIFYGTNMFSTMKLLIIRKP